MDKRVELWEKPEAEENYMIVGWRQWADAGGISSELPQYLIEKTGAKKIGEIKNDGFYLFQIPGTHHFLRPEIKLEQGYRKTLEVRKNEIFYAGDGKKGLVIFLGDEPHLNEEQYAEAFFDVAEALKVKQAAAVGGVYGPVPFDKDREISCVYSMRSMKEALSNYAVKFSNYEGGTTIGTYLIDKAEHRAIEFLAFYAFVPAYDFGQQSLLQQQGIRIETDYKGWYDLMRRFNHMFHLGINLAELEKESENLIASMEKKVKEMEKEIPQLNIREYMEKVGEEFTEMTFMPLDDVWERELGDLFDNE
jgi:predicted ATP-grasp superfamily ATP-dependent carboligase